MMRELFSLAPPLPMEMLAAVTLLVGMAGTVTALKCGESQEARAATTGRDACPTIFRFLPPAALLSAALSTPCESQCCPRNVETRVLSLLGETRVREQAAECLFSAAC